MKKLVKLFSLFFVMTGLVGFAQSTVSGTVSDSDGLPLPGATVVVQGTSIGVTSDFDGNYSISASQGDVLVFSYVGYESQTVTVGTSSTVNVSLTSSTALEEVEAPDYLHTIEETVVGNDTVPAGSYEVHCEEHGDHDH